MHGFEHFVEKTFHAAGVPIHLRVDVGPRGTRPALVLLHGFPQTHVMWRRVAQQLRQHFFLVIPDLRGYGDSGKPPGDDRHLAYAKRTMAADMEAVMDALGIDQCFVCGHDRGGRVAHRWALDAPQRVRALCVIDIVPTFDIYAATSFELAQAYYHWFHLTQPAPLPETMIGGAPLPYLHHKLGGWGSGGMGHVEPEALREYERCFQLPGTIHAICEDYRAGASIDLEHDAASRTQGQKIACDLLALWGARGVIARLFDPMALWQAQCSGRVEGSAMPAGHFIPEELPEATAEALHRFFSSCAVAT
ncbi:alpha/beta hydrolase [Curvibacter sp. APW13]|uniref:alpha/beta fold hydrolase n=1 Tax=Curvibacter sp. APW13 TaxID=3077236 RepID=UPI0028DFCB74|nr:alpha/beta hydrolase [Curvibacter sp. APW13]MDT8990844.1 alpha/beta hydrolase [Curvibacter sp. APW13]